MTPFKRRKLRTDEPVEIYRNLNKRGVWFSVRQRGKVVGHVQNITLMAVTFVVNQTGRDRCLREGRKNVHAWVRGTVRDKRPQYSAPARVYYRPREAAYFHTADGPARNAWLAVIGKDGITAWRVNAS